MEMGGGLKELLRQPGFENYSTAEKNLGKGSR